MDWRKTEVTTSGASNKNTNIQMNQSDLKQQQVTGDKRGKTRWNQVMIGSWKTTSLLWLVVGAICESFFQPIIVFSKPLSEANDYFYQPFSFQLQVFDELFPKK